MDPAWLGCDLDLDLLTVVEKVKVDVGSRASRRTLAAEARSLYESMRDVSTPDPPVRIEQLLELGSGSQCDTGYVQKIVQNLCSWRVEYIRLWELELEATRGAIKLLQAPHAQNFGL